MQTFIQIIDLHSGEILYKYPLEEMDQAYAMATLLEKNGMEVEIRSPSLMKTLSKSLGVEGEAEAEFERSVHQELDEHSGMNDCHNCNE